jgi:hypothetical protein
MTEATAVVAAGVIGAAAAVIGSLVTALLAQRETQRDRAQDALKWMTGGSQSRNVGIAAVEASWGQRWRSRRFRRLTTPVLCGTALYLISYSDEKNAPHELHNLDRIMRLLLKNPQARRFSAGYRAVIWAIKHNEKTYSKMLMEKRGKMGNTGLFVEESKLVEWIDRLTTMFPVTVTAINPDTGPVVGGTNVTVTGTGFTGATGVNFGQVVAQNLVVASDTQLTVTSPQAAAPGTVDVTVTTSARTPAISLSDHFTYEIPQG